MPGPQGLTKSSANFQCTIDCQASGIFLGGPLRRLPWVVSLYDYLHAYPPLSDAPTSIQGGGRWLTN
ncbi:hypothetical protein DESC_810163 [Desulfosarcina cetonica]|nr:hypothetical protein DESC_810163 [Desulfosarcina cetonica]